MKKYLRYIILPAVLVFVDTIPATAQETNPRLTKEYADNDKKQLLVLEYQATTEMALLQLQPRYTTQMM